MTFSISAAGIRGILLDIEGTTTPIQFVVEVLFPFARARLESYLLAHRAEQEIMQILRALAQEHDVDSSKDSSAPPWQDPPLSYLQWLMDLDRKSTALKALQGRIWQDGYRNGQLHGQVFPDVPPAFQLWQMRGLDVRIFSSGSKLAQVLLFESTESGNLTRFLNGYFDTSIGPKVDSVSYDAIATEFSLAPKEVLFISDVTKELDAARQSGMSTLLCLRPGNAPQLTHKHRIISSFEEILD